MILSIFLDKCQYSRPDSSPTKEINIPELRSVAEIAVRGDEVFVVGFHTEKTPSVLILGCTEVLLSGCRIRLAVQVAEER